MTRDLDHDRFAVGSASGAHSAWPPALKARLACG